MYANLNIFDKSNFRGYKIQGKIQSNFMQNALNFLVKSDTFFGYFVHYKQH